MSLADRGSTHPSVSNVATSQPTAMTRRSYETLNSGWSRLLCVVLSVRLGSSHGGATSGRQRTLDLAKSMPSALAAR